MNIYYNILFPKFLKDSLNNMLKEKNTQPQVENKEEIKRIVTEEAVSENPFINMYDAVRRAIDTVKEDEDNPLSPPFFKTVEIDSGQFERIIRDENLEYEVAFPAIFIHFINVRYLVQQQRLGEGRATMRIRFILNNLNNRDSTVECAPFSVFQRINVAIQDAKNHEPALNERCNLTYFDMPRTVNMLQAYWIDYEVWFRESTAWKYRNWVERYLVMPPFTDHTDALGHDTGGHKVHPKPDYEEATGFRPSVENPEADGEEEGV